MQGSLALVGSMQKVDHSLFACLPRICLARIHGRMIAEMRPSQTPGLESAFSRARSSAIVSGRFGAYTQRNKAAPLESDVDCESE